MEEREQFRGEFFLFLLIATQEALPNTLPCMVIGNVHDEVIYFEGEGLVESTIMHLFR